MNSLFKITILLLLLSSCRTTPNTKLLEIHNEVCDQYFFGITERQLVESKAFEIYIPLNWNYRIEESEDGNITYLLSEKLDTTNTSNLYDKNYNFEVISLTFGAFYPEMNYEDFYKIAMDKLKVDTLVEVTKEGLANHEDRTVNWIAYIDRQYEKDDLECQSFVSCIYNDKYYVWMIQKTLGSKDIELRKCKSIEILKTIKLKDER